MTIDDALDYADKIRIAKYAAWEQTSMLAAEVRRLRERERVLVEALEGLVELYDDDIGMDRFPCATQVEIKSTTLGNLRRARAALEAVKE